MGFQVTRKPLNDVMLEISLGCGECPNSSNTFHFQCPPRLSRILAHFLYNGGAILQRKILQVFGQQWIPHFFFASEQSLTML